VLCEAPAVKAKAPIAGRYPSTACAFAGNVEKVPSIPIWGILHAYPVHTWELVSCCRRDVYSSNSMNDLDVVDKLDKEDGYNWRD
jgi:hypothetical protein